MPNQPPRPQQRNLSPAERAEQLAEEQEWTLEEDPDNQNPLLGEYREPQQGEPWGPLSPEERRQQSIRYLERLLQEAQERDARLARQARALDDLSAQRKSHRVIGRKQQPARAARAFVAQGGAVSYP
jgi:hypothetical protein